jgi:hypothetical protein
MNPRVLLVGLIASFGIGCAHKGAPKVECDGPLRPVNVAKSADAAPVRVEPAPQAGSGEKPRP